MKRDYVKSFHIWPMRLLKLESAEGMTELKNFLSLLKFYQGNMTEWSIKRSNDRQNVLYKNPFLSRSNNSTLWDEFLTHFNAGEYAESSAKLGDFIERNSKLIQSDLGELDTLLGIQSK